jgi:hypothetical protein
MLISALSLGERGVILISAVSLGERVSRRRRFHQPG